MARRPYIPGGRCWCCPTCEVADDRLFTDCGTIDVPKYYSIRLSDGSDERFPAENPLAWNDGAIERDDGSYCWAMISQWLKRHAAGEGPDLVVTWSPGGSADYEGYFDAGIGKAGFLDSDTSDPNNHASPLSSPELLELKAEMNITSATSTAEVRLLFSGTELFAGEVDFGCAPRWAVEQQHYVKIENEHTAPRDVAAAHSARVASAKQVTGGAVYLRACGPANKLNPGAPWLPALISEATGDFIAHHASAVDLAISLDYCDDTYPFDARRYTATGSVELLSGDTVAGDITYYDTCGGTPTGSTSGWSFGAFAATSFYPLWINFNGPNPIRILPWAMGASFDPLTDTLNAGGTVKLWIESDDGSKWIEAGTGILSAFEDAPTGSAPPWGWTTQCKKHEDAAGFTFTHILFNDPNGFDLSATELVRADEVDATNVADFAAAIEAAMPWLTVSWTAHGTSPLLSMFKIEGWESGFFALKINITGGSTTNMVVC